MALLVITRPPQFTDPWFAEIEQVWDELEFAVNGLDTRVTTLESQIVNDVVSSISKSGSPQLTGDVTLTQNGSIVITQLGNNIEIGGGGVTDHGALTGLLDDDHTQYLLANGTRSLLGDWSVGNFQLLNVRMENLAANPVAGNQGRLIFNTTDLKLKVDDGTNFVNVGITDHGDLTGLLDDDHSQYLLTDGTRAVTGNFIVNGIYKNLANATFTLQSQEDNVGLPIAFIMDTATDLILAGSKLLSIQRAGVEKFFIDKDGNISSLTLLASPTSFDILIDTDNDSLVETFSIRHDDPVPASATILFTINEAGEAQIASKLRVGSLGVPTNELDIDGSADISGDLNLSVSSLIKSPSNLFFQVDTNNDESAFFQWLEGTGSIVMTLDELGNLSNTGTLSPLGDIIVDPSAVIRSVSDLVFQVDSDNNESASFVWKEGTGSPVMQLNESGDLTITGIFSGGSSPFKFLSLAPTNEGAFASASITIISNIFDAGDSVTITDLGPVAYTFTETTDFAVGVDANATAANLAAAINSVYPALAAQVNAVAVLNVVTITVETAGTAGNGFLLSESDAPTDNFTLSGATFSGGTDVASVAYELDTANNLTLAGSKLFSLKNFGVEKFFVDKDGNFSGLFVTTVDPSAGGAGIQAALTAVAAAGGGVVQLRAGTYAISSQIVWPATGNNVELRGVGASSILSSTVTGNGYFLEMAASLASILSAKVLNAVTSGDTSVTTTTGADAPNFTVGMFVAIKGTDSDSFSRTELNEVLTTGTGGGVIALKHPMQLTLTSPTITGYAHGFNNAISSLSVVHASGSSNFVNITRQHNLEIEDIYADGSLFSYDKFLAILDSHRASIRGCTVKNYNVLVAGSKAIDLNGGVALTFEHNIVDTCAREESLSGTAVGMASVAGACEKFIIRHNRILNSGKAGFSVGALGHTTDLLIANNIILNSRSSGMTIALGGGKLKDAIISNNDVSSNAIRGSLGSGIEVSGSGGIIQNCRISENTLNNNRDYGLAVVSATNMVISGNSAYKNSVAFSGGAYLLNAVSNSSFIGNMGFGVSGNVAPALSFDLCTDCTFSGNSFNTFKWGFIASTGSNSDVNIVGNTSRNNATAAVLLHSSDSNILLTGNNFRGQTVTLGTGANIISANNME